MGRTFRLALLVCLFPLSASGGQDTPRTMGDLVDEGFAIKTRVGFRSLVLQRDSDFFLCSVFNAVWGDQTWNTQCFEDHWVAVHCDYFKRRVERPDRLQFCAAIRHPDPERKAK